MKTRVRYKGSSESLLVNTIKSWTREDVSRGPVMGSSAGPKEYVYNDICTVFAIDPAIDQAIMVRGGGPAFIIVRKGKQYFDLKVSHKSLSLGSEIEAVSVR